jgi:hypothetical protein
MKQAVRISIRLQKTSDCTLWRGRPLSKQKKRCPKHSHKKYDGGTPGMAHTLSGMNGLREGAV